MEDQEAFSFLSAYNGENRNTPTFSYNETSFLAPSPFSAPSFSPLSAIGPTPLGTASPFSPPSFTFQRPSFGEKESPFGQATDQFDLLGEKEAASLDQFALPTPSASFNGFVASPSLVSSFGASNEEPFSFGSSLAGEKHDTRRGITPTLSFSTSNQSSRQSAMGIDKSNGEALPQGLQMERKILRARRNDASSKAKEQAAADGRRLLRARRTAKPQGGGSNSSSTFHEDSSASAPGDEKHVERISMQDLKLRFNDYTVPMTRALVIRAFTPNGRYMLTHDRDPTKRSWYLWRAAFETQNTFDFMWQGDTNAELLFLTNESLAFFEGGNGRLPIIKQYTLLDPELNMRRNFEGEQGLIMCHDETDNMPLEICICEGLWPCFSGLLDTEKSIAVVIATGKKADCDIVTTFQVTGMGLQQRGVCTYPRGTFPEDGQGLSVVALPQADTFVVLNAATRNPKYGCVKYNYTFEHDPKDKETGPVPLSEEEWETIQRYTSRPIFNVASILHDEIRHPIHPCLIVTDESNAGDDPAVYEIFSLSVFGMGVPQMDSGSEEDVPDFRTVHRGRYFADEDHNDELTDDEEEGDDEEEDEEEEEGGNTGFYFTDTTGNGANLAIPARFSFMSFGTGGDPAPDIDTVD